MLPTDELREAARSVEVDVSRQVEQAPEIAQLVQKLEANFDQYSSTAQRSLLVGQDDVVPDAEELGATVEEFLRSRPDDVIPGSAEGPEAPGADDDTQPEESTD